MSRLHDWLLGPRPERDGVTDQQAEAITRVVVGAAAATLLRAELRGGGRWRGGLLHGHASAGVLRVMYASRNRYVGFETSPSPLDFDPRYALGWSDALAASVGGEVDWVGSWVMDPDNQLSVVQDDLSWWSRGKRVGLFTDRHVLLSIGLRDERLTGVAYLAEGDQVLPLEVEFGRDRES